MDTDTNIVLAREYGVASLDLVPRTAQVAYLAALRQVASVNGVDAVESGAIHAIASHIGIASDVEQEASRTELSDATVAGLQADIDRAYLIRDAARIAMADGEISPGEEKVITRLANLTGLEPERAHWIVSWVERIREQLTS